MPLMKSMRFYVRKHTLYGWPPASGVLPNPTPTLLYGRDPGR